MSLESELHLQHIFYADRPLMAKYSEDSVFIARSLIKEVEELNGHANDGMTLSMYRAQEISDVKFFSLAIAQSESIELSQSNIDSVAAPYRQQLPQLTEKNREAYYKQTKKKLEAATRSLLTGIRRDRLVSQERCIQVLEEILALATVLHEILGRNSEIEMRDKLARNMLKYKAKDFADVDGDYPAMVRKSGQVWGELGKLPGQGNPGFFAEEVQVEYVPNNPRLLTVEQGIAEAMAAEGLTAEAFAAFPTVIPGAEPAPEHQPRSARRRFPRNRKEAAQMFQALAATVTLR